MKFKDVKIGQRFKTHFGNFIKVFNKNRSDNCVDTDYEDRSCFFYIIPDEEVELISNCENCKYYESESAYCDALDLTVTTKRQETRGVTALDWIAENPKTFSCSEFEQKEIEAK